jgi:hypothetical protein
MSRSDTFRSQGEEDIYLFMDVPLDSIEMMESQKVQVVIHCPDVPKRVLKFCLC